MFLIKLSYSYTKVFLLVLYLFWNNQRTMALKEDIPVDYINEISKSCHLFCGDIYKILSTKMEKNIIHSPLGLHTVLSFLSFGANKMTLTELETALHLSDDQTHKRYKEIISYLNGADTVELTSSNLLSVQTNFPITDQFLNIGVNNFYADVLNVDFSNKDDTIQKINSWVKNRTNDKINTVLEPSDIDKFTRVVLLNVIHFKGSWLHPFDVDKTVLKDFHVSNSIIKKVPTMVKEAKYKIGSIPSLESVFIEIPYKGNKFTMVVFKPNAIDGLPLLEKNFSPDYLEQETELKHVNLQLPKFKFDVTLDLNEVLEKMGMKTMFSDDANFDKMVDPQNYKGKLKVSKVFQKVYIDVNEEGTEAAAATGAVMRLKRSMNIIEDFVIDKPFMFLIKDECNIPLFVGSVRDFEDIEQTRDEL